MFELDWSDYGFCCRYQHELDSDLWNLSRRQRMGLLDRDSRTVPLLEVYFNVELWVYQRYGSVVIRTSFHVDRATGEITINRVQDVEAILERAKEVCKNFTPGGDTRPKWTLSNVQIEKFYLEWCGDKLPPPPMNQDFWKWVDKRVMSDPDYAYCRTSNKASAFFSGFKTK